MAFQGSPKMLSFRQRLRFLAKDSILYGGASAFNKAFGLITFPLLARHFSTEEFGMIDFYFVSASLLAVALVFGQDSAVARYFYEYEDHTERRELVSQSLILQAIVVSVVVFGLWVSLDHVIGLLGPQGGGLGVARIILLQLPFMVLINFSQNLLKWTFARKRFLLISVGSTVVSVAAVLVVLLWFHLGVFELFAVYLLTRFLFGLMGLWFCRQWLAFPQNMRYIRRLTIYAIPLGIIGLTAAFVPALERSYILKFLDGRELGLFAAGAKVALLVSLPIEAFQLAWGPFAYAIFKEQDASRTYDFVARAYVVGVFAVVLLLSVGADLLIRILASNKYDGASVVVFPLAMGRALQGLSQVTGVGIGLSRKSYLDLVSYGLYLGFAVVGMYGLVHVWGLAGVAWGSMVGFLALAISKSWLAQRAHPLEWSFGPIVMLTGLCVVTGLVMFAATKGFGGGLGLVLGSGGFLALLLLAWNTGLSMSERQRIRLLVIDTFARGRSL